MHAEQQLTFDRYRLDLASEQLWCGSEEIPLRGKAFAMLRYLVEHAGQLVSKAELFAALWVGTTVTDGALTFCIVELRKALGDNAKAPRFIETVHRRGYRFIAEVASSQHAVVSSKEEAKGWRLETSPVSSQASSLQSPVSSFVGRETELAQLHSWLDKALSGERQIVFVTGELGIGKTTLIEVFLPGVRSCEAFGFQEQEERQKAKGKRQKAKIEYSSPAPSPQPLAPRLWLGRGQCIEQYGPGEPYMPILEALGRLCHEPEGEHLIAVLRHHAPTWLAQMPALLSAAELEVLQRQTQGVTRERMLREMGEAVAAITAERPLILWLEDLHWSDASTLELLALLARRREPARLLVISTYRPVDVIVQAHPLRTVKQELQLHGLCEELPLGLLSETQVAEYLEHRFVVGTQHPAFLQILAKMIHHRADGNPLFMVTAVEDLIAQNVFVQHAGQWAVQEELAAIETRVPDNLQRLIAQQIERLRAEDRRMLEVASVAGMGFSAAAVAVEVEAGAEVVEEHCAGLARRGQFLRTSGTADWPDGTVAAHYSFLHALYQEVLYNRIPAGRRQRLHQRIGERQEAAYGKRAREIASELAMHFEQGRDYGKAVQYLQQAGENALRRSAYVEAINHFTKGLELLKTLPETPERMQQELTLQTALGVPLLATKGFAAPEARHIYTRARALCQQIGETPELFSALRGLWEFYHVGAELQTARTLAEQLLNIAHHVQDSSLLLEAHSTLVMTSLSLGEQTTALKHAEELLALYNPQQHHAHAFLYGGYDPGVNCLGLMALSLWVLGYPSQALKRLSDALTLAQELSHPNSLAITQCYAAQLHQLRREGVLSQQRAETAQTFASEYGLPLAWGTILGGWARAEQGQGEEGLAQMRRELESNEATGAKLERPYFLALIAEAYGKTGQVEKGLAMLDEALAQGDKTGERFHEVELYRLKGELVLQSGVRGPEPEFSNSPILHPRPQAEAEACFHKAIEIARKQQAKSWELRASTSLARLWQQQGKHHEAHTMLSDIYGWFTEGFDTKDLQEARTLLEELT